MAESTADILQQLRGIQLPPAPPEPPLWPLALASIVIATGIAVYLFKRATQRQWHHQALAELHNIQHIPQDKKLFVTAKLLRRIVLTGNQPLSTGHLTDKAWLSQLDHFFNTRYFSPGDGRVFGAELYRQTEVTPDQTEKIIRKVKTLVKYKAWFGA